MALRSIDILFPAGGQNRRLGYQRQPPFSSYLLSNVRAVDPVESRIRGGSRMGTLKSFTKQFGGGNPITLLSQLRDIGNDGDGHFVDDFLTDPALRWDDASWTTDGGMTWFTSGQFGVRMADFSGADVEKGSVLKQLEDIDTSSDYSITVTIPDILGLTFYIGSFEIFARMDNTTPNVETNGISLKLSSQLQVNNITLTLTFYTAGTPTTYTTSFDDSSGGGGKLKLTVQADNTIIANWKGTDRITQTYATTAGTRVGLGATASPTGIAPFFVTFSDVRVDYVPLGGSQLSRNRVVAAALNTADDLDLYRENNVGTMLAVTTSSLAQTVRRTYVTAERLGKLYVPNPADAAPFVYDPTLPTLDSIIALVATAGTAPTKTRIAATFLDRLVFAGDEDNPTIWYMSAQGDPLDWDYTGTTVQSAVAANTSGLYAGAAAGPITAIIPMAIDYLLIAERDRMSLLQGDPRQGGQIDVISHAVGIISATSWCHLPGGGIAFLGQNGLYRLNPGPGQYPLSISENVLPEDLKALDPVANSILMAYDPINRGILISVTPWDSIQGNHYWYDIGLGAFFPFILPLDQEPLSMLNYQSDSAADAAVLLGCRDGYIRRFHVGAVNDDGTSIDSAAWFGPIALGGDGYKEGQIFDIDLTLAANSGDAVCSVYAAETPEAAIALTSASFSETVVAGRNVLHPQLRGVSAFIVLEDSSGSGWQHEATRMRYQTLGEWRPN